MDVKKFKAEHRWIRNQLSNVVDFWLKNAWDPWLTTDTGPLNFPEKRVTACASNRKRQNLLAQRTWKRVVKDGMLAKKRVLKKVTVYRSQSDELSIRLYLNLPQADRNECAGKTT